MAREVKLETIIITRDAWRFLKNREVQRRGLPPMSEEREERMWRMIQFKNGGANPKTHSIAENEYRVDQDRFGIKLEVLKKLLEENGYGYRQDGFVEEVICL